MAQSKATKKFEKRHLKDTLEKRKGLKKTKQQQQLKAKKKSRRAEEEGRPSNGQPDQTTPKKAAAKEEEEALQHMSVDEFFQHGFDIPELPQKKGGKRKRDELPDVTEDEDGDMSDESFQQEPVPSDQASQADSASEDEDHEQQLDALAQNDPAFHKYLQDNEPELLQHANLNGLVLSEDEDKEPTKKKQKKSKGAAALKQENETALSSDDDDAEVAADKNELDTATVKKWHKALTEQHSLRAAREVVLALRAAAHVSDDEDAKAFKYSISDPQAYHLLITTALTLIPTVFEHHLPVQESKSGRQHVPTETPKFKTLAPLLRSQIASILHLLSHLSQPSTLRLTLTHTLPLLPYLLSFKKLVRDLARAAAAVWASPAHDEATRIAAFLVLRRLIALGDPGIREHVLKAAYQALVRGSRNTTSHTLPGVNLVKNSGAELWGLAAVDASGGGVAYTTAFTFIRQLAIHLRTSIANNGNDSYKTVYNWQYIHSLDFWSRVLASHAVPPTSPLRPLIYPLVQVTLGALRLIPTATHFPLRFQLVRALLRITASTGTFIPLAPAIYEVLTSAEMRRPGKPSTLKPLDFSTAIRAAAGYLHTRVYQDGVGEQVVELLGEYFGLWAKSIAFPELLMPVLVALKRWLKDANSREHGKGNKNAKVNALVAVLVQKLQAQAAYVEDARAKVGFAPAEGRLVKGFLEAVEWEKLPLGAFVQGQRKGREERAKVVEEGRREEDRKRAKTSGAKEGEEEELEEVQSDDEDESE